MSWEESQEAHICLRHSYYHKLTRSYVNKPSLLFPHYLLNGPDPGIKRFINLQPHILHIHLNIILSPTPQSSRRFWEPPTVVRNCPLARPDTEGAIHTSSGKQSSTENQKQPFYITMPRTSQLTNQLKLKLKQSVTTAKVSSTNQLEPGSDLIRSLYF